MHKIRKHILRNEAGDGGESGGAPAAADVATAAPAPSPAEQSAAADNPAPAPEPSKQESLLKKPGGEQKPAEAQSPAASDWFAKVPEKFIVKGADGAPDPVATLLKQAESYTHLEKAKSLAPAAPTDYTFTPPEEFKDLALDDAASAAFREKIHKAGMSQAQYELVMNEYLAEVPKILNAAAKMQADEARAELGKVWKGDELAKGIDAAQRAIDGAPADVRDAAWEKFGRDPDFIRLMAHYGAQMSEDSPPPTADGAGVSESVESLMASEAYRNAKHPDHAAVSKKVSAYYRRVSGDGPVTV